MGDISVPGRGRPRAAFARFFRKVSDGPAGRESQEIFNPIDYIIWKIFCQLCGFWVFSSKDGKYFVIIISLDFVECRFLRGG
jgi:hypothetical protein